MAATLEKYFPADAVNVNEAESLALGETRNVDPNRCELVLTPSATVPNDAPGKNVKSVSVAMYEPGATIVNDVDSLEAGPMMVPTYSKTGTVEAFAGLLAPRSSERQAMILKATGENKRSILLPPWSQVADLNLVSPAMHSLGQDSFPEFAARDTVTESSRQMPSDNDTMAKQRLGRVIF